MLIVETLLGALNALRGNKLRSFLTMLGIVIGVGAVIAMVARGDAEKYSAPVSHRIGGALTAGRVIGGFIRVSFGAGSAILFRVTLGWNTAVAVPSILLAFGFSAAVGVLWPTRLPAEVGLRDVS